MAILEGSRQAHGFASPSFDGFAFFGRGKKVTAMGAAFQGRTGLADTQSIIREDAHVKSLFKKCLFGGRAPSILVASILAILNSELPYICMNSRQDGSAVQ